MPLSSFIFGRVALVAGWRTTKKLSLRDFPLLTCTVYTNISVATSIPSFIYIFFDTYLLRILTKLNLQRENIWRTSVFCEVTVVKLVVLFLKRQL